MILVRPSYEILYEGGNNQLIELAGRTCYKSEDKMDEVSADRFIEQILKRGHESVIEHSMLTVKFIVDRGVTHELVRHRLCAFSQESTRYCNYKGGVTFVIPPWFKDINEGIYSKKSNQIDSLEPISKVWLCFMLDCEGWYKVLLNAGQSPQQARSVLPNSLKTEIVVTANFREWRHIFKLRCSKAAHPQMREIMISLLEDVKTRISVLFDGL